MTGLRVSAEFIDGSAITLWPEGFVPEPELGGYRARFYYAIYGPNHSWRYDANDLLGPTVQRAIDAEGGTVSAFRSLVSFLTASAEAYGYGLRGGTSENADLFPEHVSAWAYEHDTELAELLFGQYDGGQS